MSDIQLLVQAFVRAGYVAAKPTRNGVVLTRDNSASVRVHTTVGGLIAQALFKTQGPTAGKYKLLNDLNIVAIALRLTLDEAENASFEAFLPDNSDAAAADGLVTAWHADIERLLAHVSASVLA